MTPLSIILIFINYLLLSSITEGDARGYTLKREDLELRNENVHPKSTLIQPKIKREAGKTPKTRRSSNEVEGCACCLLTNGTMVADGATWWDNSVTPPQMLECCRGQILTPADTADAHNFRPYPEEVELPSKLEVVWLHLIDDIDRACDSPLSTTDWNRSSDSVEANIGMTAEQFYQEAPCKAGDYYEKKGMEGFNGDLYHGRIFGRYNNLDLSQDIFGLSVGSNHESAVADEFVVFYKNMTMPETFRGKDMTCNWFYKLPQGFSCGKGAPPDPTCGKGSFDTFTPVPCSQIEVKVLDSQERCPRREYEERYNSISRPSQPDCWAIINSN